MADVVLSALLTLVSLRVGYFVYELVLRLVSLGEVPIHSDQDFEHIVPWCVFMSAAIRASTHAIGSLRRPRGRLLGFVVYVVLTNLAFGHDPTTAGVLNLSSAILALLLIGLEGWSSIRIFLVENRAQILLLAVSSLLSLELALRFYYLATYTGNLEDLDRRPVLPSVGAEVRFGAMVMANGNDQILYTLKPGLDVQFVDVPVRTNSRGWRDGEIASKKDERTKRIIGIGDSIMFGWGVEEQDRYMDLLEVQLNATYPGWNWEIVVLATPGYNLAMEVEAFQELGIQFEPDAILYGYCGNDARLPNFVRVAKREIFSLDSFIAFYWRKLNSEIDTNLSLSIESIPAFSIDDPLDVPDQYRHLFGWEVYRGALERLEGIGKDLGVPVIYFDYSGEMKIPLPEGIRSIDAQPARRAAGEAFELNEHDPHPSKEGHRVLGEFLFDQMVKTGLVAEIMSG
ncbi:MAG: SGNH/GDSL hydrolase family protein, partial [Deltaproteobacteria bacterium]|nr:SGNH/GDSL hydrolase family protein [Deltaproteobacteria bacterium]